MVRPLPHILVNDTSGCIFTHSLHDRSCCHCLLPNQSCGTPANIRMRQNRAHFGDWKRKAIAKINGTVLKMQEVSKLRNVFNFRKWNCFLPTTESKSSLMEPKSHTNLPRDPSYIMASGLKSAGPNRVR